MATAERDEQTTERGTRTIRYREALNEALREELERDEAVFLMGEDIGVFNGAFKVTQGLLDEFGEKRVRDTPISENTIVGMGVGAAMIGLRPVVELMTVNFSLLALDQIVNSAAHIHYMFGGQVRGWYTVDSRSPGVHPGEEERKLAQDGARREQYESVVETQSGGLGDSGSGPSDAAQDSGKDAKAPDEAEA